MKALVPWDEIDAFRARALNPEHPHIAGTAQNPDIYFQNTRSRQPLLRRRPRPSSEASWRRSPTLTGRSYHLFDYVGAPDAEKVIVTMGSCCDVDRRNDQLPRTTKGEKVGLVKVRLYRPFDVKALASRRSPPRPNKIAVLDRTKEARLPRRAPVHGRLRRAGRSRPRRHQGSVAAATAWAPRTFNAHDGQGCL